jgi:hypothetical protein
MCQLHLVFGKMPTFSFWVNAIGEVLILPNDSTVGAFSRRLNGLRPHNHISVQVLCAPTRSLCRSGSVYTNLQAAFLMARYRIAGGGEANGNTIES